MPPSRRTSPAADLAAGENVTDPTTRATPRGAGPGTAKSKVGFYQNPDDTARARAAYDWTRPYEGHRSFSDFVASALMREVERLEAKHHGGEPWPAVEPGQLPTGKPLG